MLNILLIVVFITYVHINAYNKLPNNIYKNINIDLKNSHNVIKNSECLPPYKIPKWVYKKVFKYNKFNKELKEKDYYYQIK